MNMNVTAGRADFRSGSPFSAVLSSLRYRLETHPAGSDTQVCFTLHFAKNGNEKRAMSLKSALPAAINVKKYRGDGVGNV